MAKEKVPSAKTLKALQEAGGLISYDKAAKLTKAWREENGDVAKVDKKTGKKKVKKGAKAKKYVKAFYLNRANLDKLLTQKECTGVRVYLGWERGEMTAMLVGTKIGLNGLPDDLVPPQPPSKSKKKSMEGGDGSMEEDTIIVNHTVECPPICGNGNGLNGGNP
jgi:hypothetical protein